MVTDLDVYKGLEAEIDAGENVAIWARWRFGKALVAERRPSGLLPEGRLDEICNATGRSRSEIKYRMQFAEQYPEDQEVATVVATCGSWTSIRDTFAESTTSTAELLVASSENEWYTPHQYLDAARAVLGGIDLDPASSVSANETVRAAKIYTKYDDGLAQPWAGTIWLNPPYGNLAGAFIDRLVAEYHADEITAAVALVNAHCTDTNWFQPLWQHTLCFTDHRIDFESAGRDKTSTSTHGSVFAYLGTKPAVFADQFAKFGVIVRRWS